ncbi:hypothetical protein [Paenibacillus radicis (ex Gao et al. 2016)]|uniref:DUF5050 domain-containing protein n=1 Tax=Paenibacillus radicis (ex Gao et al. 2016) TaxID=1737354 RepID=A0A917GUV0_9BACL|nr:hypothetical protein [Paenibacillus radicis (ex Gao et al. 2016)]GGG57917.1 hypothetical protein GCM10010918_08710 [Paenibacillus radicis (ex Gao et al. 2016)]
MKKIIGLLGLVFMMILYSCVDNSQNKEIHESKQTIIPGTTISNETISIYDIHNAKIGEIERYGILVLTDDSIIYNRIPTGSVDLITEMDYYRYIFATKEIIKLGTVENFSYEAKYDTTVIGNSLYMMVTTGEISEIENRTLHLYKVDLISNTMSVVFSEEGGFPYNTMTAVGDKLFMIRVNPAGGSELEVYNTETNERKIVKKFEFNDKANIGEAIRQITSDEKTVSLLRLKMESGEKSRLYLDVYDHDMNFLRSVDVSTIPSHSTDSPENELRQGVSNFVIANDYIYYANFSITRFLGEIENDSLRSIMDVNPEFEMASESVKSKYSGLFYQSFSKDNDLYLLNYTDGKLRKTTFNADDERYYIVNISRNTNDNLLITMKYSHPDTGEELEPKLYYVNLSELEFS